MNGLEALEDIILYLNASEPKGLYCENIETIQQALLKVEKDHKALKIINKKNVAVAMFKSCGTVEMYNTIAFDYEHFKDKDYARKLTEEEFNLLKEVLE